YNTLTRKKEEFIPINKDEVKIYACGPTVYNFIHIGNARPICVFDVLRRYLNYIGYNVKFVQNFTDVDDKIIKKAKEDNSDFLTVSEKYIDEYKKDAGGLNVLPATYHPKATENIAEMIKIVQNLIDKGFAYALPNGDVYFKTRTFKDYGKLSHQTIDDLQSGARIQIDESKKDPLDFALWKAAKPGEPFWESPWGKGRPGWHIECSAMASEYLGKTIDIHCGGQDLIFPHHENEIAQSECCFGTKFANYWLHNGYINVDSKKMSKSLGNFFTVRDIAQKYGYEPIRYLMISSHYRNPVNYSEEIIAQCAASLERLRNFRENLDFALKNANDEIGNEINLSIYKNKFIDAMNEDLNTADALGVIFEMVRTVNTEIIQKNKFNKTFIENLINLFDELCEVLGILYDKNRSSNNLITPQEIENLIKEREQARKDKNWARADEIREELSSKNIILEDTASGTKYTFK
ncbi:MAG: cysteine--tRNA ligase, partial [Acutalibacteraceae bacterium]